MSDDRRNKAFLALGIVFIAVGISVDTIALWILGTVFIVISITRRLRTKTKRNLGKE
jgi:hypothetical protein